MIDLTMSNVGCLTNPTKLANAVQTILGTGCSRNTIVKYLDYFTDSFLIAQAKRFDVKGNRYLDYPVKYYAMDTGLRNARLDPKSIETL